MEKSRNITHEGELHLNGLHIPCYVLEDGTRVLSGRGLQSALRLVEDEGKAEQRGGGKMGRILDNKSLKPFIYKDKDLAHFSPISCHLGKQSITGYEASVLSELCDAILEARAQGALKSERQQIIAAQCEILIRAFARVGIIALVDEATGYQEVRPRDALQKYLDTFLLKEYAKWVRRFPNEFFEAIFRMKGWTWDEASTKKPVIVATYINDFVYQRLAPLILEELQNKNPVTEKGRRKTKHHQWLTPDIGHPKLQEHLQGVMAIQRIAGDSWVKFKDMMDRAYPRYGHTMAITFEEADQQERQSKPPTPFDQQLKGLLSVPPPPKDDKASDSEDEEPTPDEEPKKPKKPRKK